MPVRCRWRAAHRWVPAAILVAALSLATATHARPVTPRGDLTPDERVTIDVFEKSKRSVVFISTSERVRDLWTRNVRSIPRGTGSASCGTTRATSSPTITSSPARRKRAFA